ncbi:MAG TPA: FtsX-like permease family protein, partial [Gammaproteobacteria bacterium]
IGEQLTLTGLGETEPRIVVGIVSDVVLNEPLRRGSSSVGVYVPLRQTDARAATVALRHRGSEQAARAAYHETLTALDPLLVSEITSFEEILQQMTALASSVTRLLGACVAFALLLATSGTYGLMALSIGRRTREIGVRRALGASDGRILAMLLGQGAKQLGIGALIALPLLLAIGWVFSLALPVSFYMSVAAALGVSAVITLIVLAATWLPTRRAIAIAPRDALWRE